LSRRVNVNCSYPVKSIRGPLDSCRQVHTAPSLNPHYDLSTK